MKDISQHILGEHDEDIRVASAKENRSAALALAGQARRSLDIFTWKLDKAIYDNEPFVEAVKQLALSSPRVLIRILVQDSSHAAKNGHRLVNLSHRLTSRIQFRQPSAEHHGDYQAFLIADGVGLLKRNLSDYYEGRLNFKAANEVRELLNYFNLVWDNSSTDPRLRRLTL